MKSSTNFRHLFMVLMLCWFAQAHAVTKTFTESGNFSDAANWSGGTLPVVGDDLILNGTCTVDNSVSTDNVAYGTLVIGGSVAGTLNWGASGTNRLNVTHVSASMAASSLDMTNGGTLIIRGTWTSTNLSFTPGTGTIDLRSTLTLPSAYTTYNGLIINASSNTVSASAGISVTTFSMVTGTFNLTTFTLTVTGTATFTAGTINNGTVTSTAATTTFSGTIFGANVNATSNALYLNGSTFNSTAILTKNGASDITSTGGNTFNSTATITNNSSGFLILANTTADVFNGDVTFASIGSDILYVAYNSAGNQINGNATFTNTGTATQIHSGNTASSTTVYNGNIVVNNTSMGIYFGENGGTTTLADTKTITIGGTGFSAGVLTLRHFTQVGTTAQAFTLTGSGSMLAIGPGSTFNGGVNFTAPQLYASGTTFQGTTTLRKSGSTDNANTGGNVFNGVATLTNSGSGSFDLGTTNPETFNSSLTVNNTGTSRIQLGVNSVGNVFNGTVTINHGGTTNSLNTIIARNAGSSATFNGNLFINNTNTYTNSGVIIGNDGNVAINGNITVTTTSGRGVLFGAASGTVTLGNGYTITDGGAGTFTTGTLSMRQFIQTGNTAQNITLTGTANLTVSASSQFNGAVNFSAPQVFVMLSTFNGPASFTKTGATDNTSTGGNTFNAATTFANSGTGFLRLASSFSDDFNAGATFSQTGSGLLQPAYASSNTTFAGNISTAGTAAAIHFGTGNGTVALNGTGAQAIGNTIPATFYNLTVNNTSGAVLQQPVTVSNVLTLTNGPLNLNSKTLTLSNSATSAITSTNGYLVSEQTDNSSKVAWNMGTTTGAHIFPFGALGSMIPLTVNLTAGDIGTVTVSTYHTNLANLPYPTSPTVVGSLRDDMGNDNSTNVVDRFWQLDKTGPSGTATLTFLAAGSEIGALEGVVAQRWNSSAVAWDAPIPGQNNVVNGVIVPGVTLTGPWAMVAMAAPLPVELLGFEAFQREDAVAVKWATANEINSAFFEVERSVDGVEFAPVVRVAAAGRSTGVLQYDAVDGHPVSGVSYYRLRQVDLEGAVTLSSRVEVNYASAAKPYLVCVPNPTAGTNIHLRVHRAKGQEVVMRLTDLRGMVLSEAAVQVADEIQEYDFAPRVRLAPGMYIASATSAQETYYVRVIVR